MKNFLLFLGFVFLCPQLIFSQITTPVIKARFGVDADLRANFFNGLSQAGNDDWFNLNAADTTGKAVIDTNGAAALVASYLSDVSPWPRRMGSYFRTMSRPTFSIVNNRLWLDALWVRDYHGTDTTVFAAGSNKNGMSPEDWTGTIQGIPDKNDILDIFLHIRRAGPNTTDSLWMFGGISLDNTTGNRYFDFEMYQTDIYYDRASGNWYGYGADAGHTSWQFDAAGNVTRPGDIIFSGDFQSSTLTNVEARIWVSRATWMSTTPAAFNWSGLFDGASSGSTYGYASILPKTTGAYYTGLGSAVNTWAGPFQLVLQNNNLTTTYIKDQFIELSVNLSKLGLDPVGLSGGDICGTPFNRIVVKTRASASFTAELKDFVAPTDLFLAPRVQAVAEMPLFCDSNSVTDIYVINPSASSIYEWYTPNGNIVGTNIGPVIRVDATGDYIVTQRLSAGCNPYAYDTVTIFYDSLSCGVLNTDILSFRGTLSGSQSVQLKWTVTPNNTVGHFEVERSVDGHSFYQVGRLLPTSESSTATYTYYDELNNPAPSIIQYRLKVVQANGRIVYSNVVTIKTSNQVSIKITPVPVRSRMQVSVTGNPNDDLTIFIYDPAGKMVYRRKEQLQTNSLSLTIDDVSGWKNGLYMVAVVCEEKVFYKKVLILR